MREINKLVRDNIVDEILREGEKPTYTTVKNDEYLSALNLKLLEEAQEFVDENSIEELADVLEVIYAITKYKGIDLNEVEKVRLKKLSLKGGFERGIYLKTVN